MGNVFKLWCLFNQNIQSVHSQINQSESNCTIGVTLTVAYFAEFGYLLDKSDIVLSRWKNVRKMTNLDHKIRQPSKDYPTTAISPRYLTSAATNVYTENSRPKIEQLNHFGA